MPLNDKNLLVGYVEVLTKTQVSKNDIKAKFPNVSFPSEFQPPEGYAELYEGPQATGGEFWQYFMQSGVEHKNGKWYTKYILGPVFTDAEEQAAYIAQKTKERNEGIQSAIVDATQKRLDEFAQTRNYAGILSACTYATSTVPRFASDGQYCVESRDATWAKLYEILDEVTAGDRPMPCGYDDIKAELPVLEWPDAANP